MPKAKGTPGGNPNPVQNAKFKAYQQQPIGQMPDEPLALKPVSVKVGCSVKEYLDSLSSAERITLCRTALAAAVKEHQNQ
jgi:hypothetical protein